ncbi:MAG: helix-turn-helix domain-containing protein [Hyphomicrobiales bacterium]
MDQTLAKSIGKHVKAARKQRRLTQPQLAEKIDKTYETVSNIERGFTPPSIQTLADISVALAVPLKDFFDDSLLQEPSDQKQALLDQITRSARSLDESELRMLHKLSVAVKSDP